MVVSDGDTAKVLLHGPNLFQGLLMTLFHALADVWIEVIERQTQITVFILHPLEAYGIVAGAEVGGYILNGKEYLDTTVWSKPVTVAVIAEEHVVSMLHVGDFHLVEFTEIFRHLESFRTESAPEVYKSYLFHTAILMLSSEKIFAEEWTNAQDVGRNDGKEDDEQGNHYRQRGVEHEIMTVFVEENADGRNIGQEEEVQQIDVERPASDILQGGSNRREFGEVLLVVTEIHEDDD